MSIATMPYSFPMASVLWCNLKKIMKPNFFSFTALFSFIVVCFACSRGDTHPVPLSWDLSEKAPVGDTPPAPLPWDLSEQVANRNTPPVATLVIMLDTLRSDYLGCYGADISTPNIDKLANEGALFEFAYSTSTWTKSACASIFTGLYPNTLGVHGAYDAISESHATIGQVWKEAGKSAYGITTNGNAGKDWGFARGFSDWRVPSHARGLGSTGQEVPKHRAEVVVDEFKSLLKENDVQKGDLFWLHFVDPHAPLYDQSGQLGADMEYMKELDSRDVSEAEIEHVKDLYSGEIEYLDIQLGALFEHLRLQGLFEESLIIIVSDHGEGLWDHGERGHGKKPYDEQIHVPLIVRTPTSWGIPPLRDSTAVSIIDIFPTVLGSNNLPIPTSCQGVALFDILYGEGRSNTYVYNSIAKAGVFFESLVGNNSKIISPGWLKNIEREHLADGEKNAWQIAFDFYGNRNISKRSGGDELVQKNKDVLPEGFRSSEKVPNQTLLAIPNLLPVEVDELFALYENIWTLQESFLNSHEILSRTLATIRKFNLEATVVRNERRLSELDEELLEHLEGLGYVDGSDDYE